MSAEEPGTLSMECVVLAVIPKFRQTKVRAADGRQYAITDRTTGVDWAALREGQRVRCVVTVNLPRVISATPVAEEHAGGARGRPKDATSEGP